jgi:hypothetical protein
MDPWWTRDQGIGWPAPAKDPERNLRQKDESVGMWEEIVDLANAIQWPDGETSAYARGSAQYGLRLYRIYRALVCLADAENRGDRDGMRTWLSAYDSAWTAYESLPLEHTGTAALYTRDYGRHLTPAEQHLVAIRAARKAPVQAALLQSK